MNWPNPFAWLNSAYEKRMLYVSSAITLPLIGVMNLIDRHLINSQAVHGIISFELAGNFRHSQQLLASWNASAKVWAGLSLGVDYLFIAAYSLFLALCCYKIATGFLLKKRFFYHLGMSLSWLIFVAALLDIIENYSLIRLLFGSQASFFSGLAFYCAGLKFILISFGIIYIVWALLRFGLSKLRMS